MNSWHRLANEQLTSLGQWAADVSWPMRRTIDPLCPVDVLQFIGAAVCWCCSVLVLQCIGAAVLQCNGAAVQWCCSAMALQCCSAMVLQGNSAAMHWCCSTLVDLFALCLLGVLLLFDCCIFLENFIQTDRQTGPLLEVLSDLKIVHLEHRIAEQVT